MREDLYNMYALYMNPDQKENLFYLNYLNIVVLDLKSIPENCLYHKMDEGEKEDYLKILEDNETKYAMVANGKLIDGMHRVTALLKKGETKMLAVDASKYININETGYICDVSYKTKSPKNKMRVK